MSTDNRPPPYSMRLDPVLRAKLEESAKNAGRSLHAEIAMRLEDSFRLEAATDTSHATRAGLEMLRRMQVENELPLTRDEVRKIAREVFSEMLRQTSK